MGQRSEEEHQRLLGFPTTLWSRRDRAGRPGGEPNRPAGTAGTPGTAVFWQLTIDSVDPVRLARFWEQALGYQPAPPARPDTTWNSHYRNRLRNKAGYDDRLFDPAGVRPPLWFQKVPEAKAGKNRLHLDLYPTGRDNSLTVERRIQTVEAKVARLTELGATVQSRTREDDPEDPVYYVVMADPEGNEFCVS